MAKEKNYINLSINELEKYIEKKYADVLASYPLGVMEIRKGIKLTTLEDGSLYLDTLNIRTAAQGQGKGKEVLNILKNWADANKVAIYIKPAYLPDNPTFKGIETTPEKQVENLFNFYKNNGWEDNPNFTSLSPNEQSAQLSLSANAEWGASTDDLYSPLVYTPEGVDIPELPKNPYINDIISTAEKFNIDGKAFVDGYNQPILDETIQGILKIEPIFGLSGYGLEVDEWKKSKFSEISDLLVEQGIDPSDIKDISKYIPRDKILTPAQIFQGNMRNEYFTDEIVEMLKEDVGGFFELDDAGDELFPQNRPKRNYRLYYIISQGDDVGGKLYQEYVQDISGPFNKTPEPTKWIDYLVKGKRTVEPDTPTNVVDDFGQKGIKWADARKALEDVNNWGDDIPLLLETFIPNPGNLPVDKIILEIIPPEGNIEGLIPSEDYRLQASILRENGDIEIIKTYDNPRQFGADGKNFFNDISFIDTPTNVVDDVPDNISVGGVREEPFFNFGDNIDIPLQINEQGNVILYRTTDSPDYLQVSDFRQKNTSNIGTLGFGQHTYFGPNIETPQAFWVASTNRGLYKYDTNIKPSEIFIGNIGDKPDLAKALGIPKQYWNMNYHRFLIETKDTYRKVLTDNIETFKQYGIKALGRYGGTSGEKAFEIIPLITNEDNLGVKAVAELEPIEGIGKGGAANWKVKEVITDTPGGSLGAAKLNDPLVFDSWIDNYANTTTSFVDNLPLVKPVKDMFLNAADNRIKRLARQAATPGGILDAVDIWEIGVLALVAGAIAYNEIDEIPKIGYNAILRTYNLSQGRPIDAPLRIIGLPTLEISEYDIDFEYAMETLERGEKVMPTDIIIKELAESSLEKGEPAVLPGTGVTATTGIDEEFAPYKESIIKEREETARIKRDEVKQKILESKGVQEEKMFEQAKPKKSKATGGAGAKIL